MAVVAVIGAGALGLDGSRLPTMGLQLGVLDGLLALAAVALVIYVQGLPPRIAQHVGIGRRSREWEFDRRLHLYRERLDASLRHYPSSRDWPSYRRWRAQVLRDGHVLVARMKGMHAPDDGWAGVRDDYVDLYSEILARIALDDEPDDAYTSLRGGEIKQRANILRLEYRASADALIGRR